MSSVSFYYVIETDAPCKVCGGLHEYVTNACQLVVFTDYSSAYWVAKQIEGSAVREIRDIPDGIPYHLYIHENGRPNARVPSTVSTLSGG